MTTSEQIADELYGLHCDIGRLETENARLRQELAMRQESRQERVIEYLRQECIDWEDKYRALAAENDRLRSMLGEDVRSDDKVQ